MEKSMDLISIKELLKRNNLEFVELLVANMIEEMSDSWQEVVKEWEKANYNLYTHDDNEQYVQLMGNERTADDAVLISNKPFEWNGPAIMIKIQGIKVYCTF